jgi:hypothetical protein
MGNTIFPGEIHDGGAVKQQQEKTFTKPTGTSWRRNNMGWRREGEYFTFYEAVKRWINQAKVLRITVNKAINGEGGDICRSQWMPEGLPVPSPLFW